MTPLASTYAPQLAVKLLHLAEASYCPDSRVRSWHCPPCKLEPTFNVTHLVSNSTYDTHGFVGHDAGTITASFRGTDPLAIKSWLVDLESAVLADYPHQDGGCTGCKVGDGFLRAFEAVRNETVGAVLQLAQRYPQYPVLLTGHSLGAAYVALLAMELWRHGLTNVTVVTYGQPRVGNAAFASGYANATAASRSRSWRLTHFADPVPHLPLEAMAFRHVSTEVHYDELNREYAVCDGSGEDLHCADGVAVPLLITDHWSYLGINFLDEYTRCKLVEERAGQDTATA